MSKEASGLWCDPQKMDAICISAMHVAGYLGKEKIILPSRYRQCRFWVTMRLSPDIINGFQTDITLDCNGFTTWMCTR